MERILEALELVGGKYLSWVRVLRKRNKKGFGSVREKVSGSAGVAGRWVLELECWSTGALI